MNNFLKSVAEYIFKTHREIISDCCMVFPNRRASLFFAKHLASLSEQPIWSPEMLTVNDFMQKYSDLQKTDSIALIVKLFRIFKSHKSSFETLDNFYFWGEILLSDFDDIDKYMVNAKHLFENLSAIKEIENRFDYLSDEEIEEIKKFWKVFDENSYTKIKEDYISVWNVLFEIYNDFTSSLKREKKGYEGMIYRDVAEKITNNIFPEITYKKIFFIGFNAISTCENKLFSYLKSIEKASFFWDYDKYYLDDPKHEAGYFQRKNTVNFKSEIADIYDNLSDKKNITYISVETNIAQAKVAGNILENLHIEISENPESTAIILPDENLLIPVLHSLPENIAKVNVTMGFPLKVTSVYGLIKYLFQLNKNAITNENNEQLFYADDVIHLLNFPLLNINNVQDNDILIQKLIENKIDYLSISFFEEYEFLQNIFKIPSNNYQFLEYLVNILKELYCQLNIEENEKNNFEKEYIYHSITTINKIIRIFDEEHISFDDFSFELFFSLLDQSLRNVKIPFSGEPLAGLQIIGLLETRALDFNNVILLSMNEGIFPPSQHQLSFIPFSLRKGFGLPTSDHLNSISSYIFYRSLQRAKNIFLIYNTSTEKTASGEMSRFLHQLKIESNFEISEKSLIFNINIPEKQPIIIKKSEKIIKKLASYLSGNEKYLSPSAISCYIDCSLKFYFNYIEKFDEQEVQNEELDPATFGNILHQTISDIYKPYLNLVLNNEKLSILIENEDNIEKYLMSAFSKYWYKNFIKIENKNELNGRNFLVFEVLKKYIKLILSLDTKFVPYKLLEMEKEFFLTRKINVNDCEYNIQLGGKIDRIDLCNEKIRIIDYKTGTIKNSVDSISSLFDTNNNKRNAAIFQSLFYSFLYKHNKTNKFDILPAIYPIRSISQSKSTINININNIPIDDFSKIEDEFNAHLTDILIEMFDNEKNYQQTQNTDICPFCPYQKICNR